MEAYLAEIKETRHGTHAMASRCIINTITRLEVTPNGCLSTTLPSITRTRPVELACCPLVVW